MALPEGHPESRAGHVLAQSINASEVKGGDPPASPLSSRPSGSPGLEVQYRKLPLEGLADRSRMAVRAGPSRKAVFPPSLLWPELQSLTRVQREQDETRTRGLSLAPLVALLFPTSIRYTHLKRDRHANGVPNSDHQRAL